MKKITTVTMTDNNIISAVDKIHPEDGDFLLFYVKTDDAGVPVSGWNEVETAARVMGDLLKDKGAWGVFIMDKICLFSIENAEELTRTLDKQISAIQKAKRKLGDFKNGKSGEPYFIIDIKEIEDQD